MMCINTLRASQIVWRTSHFVYAKPNVVAQKRVHDCLENYQTIRERGGGGNGRVQR